LSVHGPLEIVGDQSVDDLHGVRARDFQLAHVGDVEQTSVPSHALVLVLQSCELDWHFPTRERHHAGTQLAVQIEERRALQLLGHGGSVSRTSNKLKSY